MGTGRLFLKAFNKYGKENFIKEIIGDYSTRKEASDHEKLIVTMDLVENTQCYNLRTGGDNENVHSPETIQKLRNANLGKTVSEEVRKKMSISTSGSKNPQYGKPVTESTRNKIRNGNLGKKLSDEHKQKLSVAFSGSNHPLYGKHHSKETREKISKSHQNKIVSSETREKLRIAGTGRKITEETRIKLRLAQGGENHPMYGKKHKPEVVEQMKTRMIGNKISPRKKCQIDLIIFESLSDACKYFKISYETLQKRLKSGDTKWTTWNYLNLESLL